MAYIECSFFSEVLGYETTMNVLLPKPFSKEKKYPVLYLLHGMSDDHSKWMRYTSIERYANENNIAVVMPSVLRGYYTDMHRGYNYFTFISEEVPKIAKSLFPITDDPKMTYVAGLSMGGYGAFKLALTYPQKYAAAGSFSGSLDMGFSMKQQAEMAEDERQKEFENIFSSIEDFTNSQNDLMYLSEQAAKSKEVCPLLYQWCGTSDFLYQANLNFKNHAEKLNLPLTYEEGEGGHQWKYWDKCIQRFFEFIKE